MTATQRYKGTIEVDDEVSMKSMHIMVALCFAHGVVF